MSMGDIQNPRLLYAKGFMFLLIGLAAALLLILDRPKLMTAVLLATCIWAFCRAYYFAFYVIEHYIDRDYQFDGLYSAFRHILSPNNRRKRSELE